jgi:hypothetical protein
VNCQHPGCNKNIDLPPGLSIGIPGTVDALNRRIKKHGFCKMHTRPQPLPDDFSLIRAMREDTLSRHDVPGI